jgi:hypothetical protein
LAGRLLLEVGKSCEGPAGRTFLGKGPVKGSEWEGKRPSPSDDWLSFDRERIEAT